MSMNIGGAEAILKQLDEMSRATPAEIQAELDKAANGTLVVAYATAPEQTGFLKQSGHADSGDLEATVTFDADYALYVEMGHMSRAGNPVPPQHFLLPAFEDQAQKLQERLDALNSKTS